VLATVLHTLGRQDDHLPGEVDLTPLEMANLVPALPCQEEKSQDIAERIITKAAP
jgi:hypothetical protein